MEIHGTDYECEVRVSVHFHAHHALPSRPELHGHRWEVEFAICGPINPDSGMVCDMLDLAAFFQPFANALDGVNLHDFKEFQDQSGVIGLAARYPTCDTLAHYFLWKAGPPFHGEPRFHGLRIGHVKVSIYEPGQEKRWGSALIRPKIT